MTSGRAGGPSLDAERRMRDSSLNLDRFARFYAPLAATSLLLTATNPLLTAAMSRSVNPATALAGFGVAFSLCGVLYAPLLVAQQVAATKLLAGRPFGPVRGFWVRVGLLCSLLAVAVAITPLGEWIFGNLMGVRGDIFDEARQAMVFLAPVPLLTAFRALHQGRLVAGHRTHPIALATGFRTGVLAVVAFVLTAVTPAGAWVGAAAFTAGLLVEALVVARTRAGADGAYHPVAAEGVALSGGENEDRMLRFSTPLMANVILWWGTPLLIDSVLARTAYPAEAIAAFVVVEAVAWFVTAPVGQFQHVSIALVDCEEAHRSARRWALALAAAVAAVLALVSIPAIRIPVLGSVFELDQGLLSDIGTALPFTVAYPFLYGHRQYYQGLFIRTGRSDAVGWGAVLRVFTVLVVAVTALAPLGERGAVLGVVAATVGLAVEGLFLERVSQRQVMPALARSAPVRTVPAGGGVNS